MKTTGWNTWLESEAAYLEAALRRSRHYKASDIEAANQAYDELHDLKNQMRVLLPDRGEAILKRFVKHSDIKLRISCAHLLAVDESFAPDELHKIENSERGFASVTAKYTIRE